MLYKNVYLNSVIAIKYYFLNYKKSLHPICDFYFNITNIWDMDILTHLDTSGR